MSIRSILLKGGHVVDPTQRIDDKRDVLLMNGEVADVNKLIAAPDDAQVIDVSGLIVSPGFIDVHVHLREPGG